jgi:hypothetical protein
MGGIIRFKRIPETSEEEAEVGDRPYGITLYIEEIVPSTSLDMLAGPLMESAPIDPRLLAQFLFHVWRRFARQRYHLEQ